MGSDAGSGRVASADLSENSGNRGMKCNPALRWSLTRFALCWVFAALAGSLGMPDVAGAKSGQKVPVNDALLIFHEQFKQPQLVQVRPGIYVAYAYGLANFTFIEGPNKIVVVDTGWFRSEMEAALRDLRKITDKPIGAVIYTHAHPDHNGGTGLLAKDFSDVPIYAAAGFAGSEWDNSGRQFGVQLRRAYAQLGLLLDKVGEDPVGGGVGRAPILGPRAYLEPTSFISEPRTIMIDGLDLSLIPAGMDVPEGLMVWLEDQRVLLAGDTVVGVFTILETPRYIPSRDPALMARSFDIALALKPAIVISGHGRLLLDEADAGDVLTVNRNLANLLIDQVDRLIDQGLGIEQIVHAIEIPPHLVSHPDLQPFYHRKEWIIRTLVTKRIGWYTELMDLVRDDGVTEAENLAAMVGGDHLEAAFCKAMERGEHRWAARIAHWLMLAKGRAEDRMRYLGALKGVAAQTMSVNERSYILSEEATAEGKIDWQEELVLQRLAYARKLSSRELVDQLRMRTDPATAGTDLTFALNLTDGGERFVLLRQDGAVMFADPDRQPNLTIEMPRERLNQFHADQISWTELLKQSDVELYGDRHSGSRIFDR